MSKESKILSFDIEICDVFTLAPFEDLEKHAPFRVAVAATAIHKGDEEVWYSTDEMDRPALEMTKRRAREYLEYLEYKQLQDYKICAWNGLGFDLKWLGHHAEATDRAARIALKSFDPMFQFFNSTGYPVSLAKVAEAMGITERKLMSGSDAPVKWRAGKHKEVMDYVLGDCRMTNLIVRGIEQSGQVQWITSKGYSKSLPMPRLKSVSEVIADLPPDQSWMDSPIPKSKFFGWVDRFR